MKAVRVIHPQKSKPQAAENDASGEAATLDCVSDTFPSVHRSHLRVLLKLLEITPSWSSSGMKQECSGFKCGIEPGNRKSCVTSLSEPAPALMADVKEDELVVEEVFRSGVELCSWCKRRANPAEIGYEI